MPSSELWKNKFVKISKFILIFAVIFSWMFSGWPRIWPFGPSAWFGINELGINKIRIPSENSGDDLSTILLLTAVFAFAIFKVVNPPRPKVRLSAGFLFW